MNSQLDTSPMYAQQMGPGASIVAWSFRIKTQNCTTTDARLLSDMPPEIMENIFEKLASMSWMEYDPDVKRSLLSCLFVSKYLRDFALPRLFQSIRVSDLPSESSKGNRLCLLLDIIAPSSLEWMSILPYIRRVVFCHGDCGQSSRDVNVGPRTSSELLTLLHTLSTGTCRLTSLEFPGFRPWPATFTPEFKSAIAILLKKPLHSIKFRGPNSPVLDLLRGTHIGQLISKYYSNIVPLPPPPSDKPDRFLSLRSLVMDTTSYGVEDIDLLQDLEHFSIFIDCERSFYWDKFSYCPYC